MFFRSPAWDSLTYWALDLETTGLRPKEDSILSVGMVPLRDGVIHYGERFYSLVRPKQEGVLSDEGLRAHHILPSESAAAPTLGHVLPEVDRRLRDSVLLLHFADLDVNFLRRAYQNIGWAWTRPTVVDTVDLLLKLQRRRQQIDPNPARVRTALTEARADMGLPPHEAHHALADAMATAELFLALRARLGASTLRDLR